MREIKFRAWDKKYKNFIPVNPFPKEGWIKNEFSLSKKSTDEVRVYDGVSGKNMFFTLDGRFVSVCPYDDLHTVATDDSERYEIQQYTGLKDKNGKEIFEGDILTSLYKKDGCKGIYEVRWDDGMFKLRKHKEHQQNFVTIVPYDLRYCEIIGNIYENPDLLQSGGGE